MVDELTEVKEKRELEDKVNAENSKGIESAEVVSEETTEAKPKTTRKKAVKEEA